jgi:hypothetical protein
MHPVSIYGNHTASVLGAMEIVTSPERDITT